MKNEDRERALKLLEIAPCDWQVLVEEPECDGHGNHNGKGDTEWQEIADDLEAAAIRALLLAEYIQNRRGGYCGNHATHEDASKRVSKLHVRVRRACGYTMPSSGILHI